MTHIKRLSTFLLFSLLISTFAHAADGKLLWDHWYVITLNGKVPYGYYNEKTETKDGRYIMSINLWKQEENFVNHESMGVYSKTDDVLTPLFFNAAPLLATPLTTTPLALPKSLTCHVPPTSTSSA